MFNSDYDGQYLNDYDTPTQASPQAGPTAVQQGLQPVPGHPGLFFNTGGVVFNEAGTQVDGYVNPATGAFQTGTPTTDPNTGIIGPPTTTTTPAPGPLPPGPQPPTNGGGGAPPPTTGGASSFPSGQTAPTFTPPTYEKPEPWNYQSFVAPSPDEVNTDPWTQYQLKTEADQIQRSAAARGILNTGGTINQLLTGANDIVNAGYGNIFNRAAQTYGMNRQNSLDAFNTKYKTSYSDPEKWSYQGAQDQYAAQQHNFDSLNNFDWARVLFGADREDSAFDKRYRIYSSL